MIALQDQAFHLYREGKELLASRLAQADGPAAASRLIVDAFRELWPGARFCYCRLESGETHTARALDDKGEERPSWATALDESVGRDPPQTSTGRCHRAADHHPRERYLRRLGRSGRDRSRSPAGCSGRRRIRWARAACPRAH